MHLFVFSVKTVLSTFLWDSRILFKEMLLLEKILICLIYCHYLWWDKMASLVYMAGSYRKALLPSKSASLGT